ncbi:MAG: PEP/pyruvate-binding domain-containing protein [Candidatus Pacebacteria bacterium]|nr:PEP/pyruvate-binding domain-containing protein [Candidatus Paceibacterota bacterium]
MYHIISKVKGDISEKLIGEKATNLIKLKKRDFNVPDFFIISSDIDNVKLFQIDIGKEYDNLGGDLVAVRSSAVGEDSVSQSFAGQYKTILSVSRDGLMDAINECRDSLNSQHALAYSKNKIINKMAIIVQKMVLADISGVSFSADPIRNNKNFIIIESVKGPCDQLVSGMVTPNHYVINKDKINEESLSENIKEVAFITKEIENKFGYCVDVEWVIQDGILYILQVRPITTLDK